MLPRPPEALGTCTPGPPSPLRWSSRPLPPPFPGACSRELPRPQPQVAGSRFWHGAWEALRIRGTSEDPGRPAPPTGPSGFCHEVAPGRLLPALAIKARLGILQALLPGPAPRAKSHWNGPLHISGSAQGWEVSWLGTIRPHSSTSSCFFKTSRQGPPVC